MNDVDLIACTLSAWTGEDGRCRWCDKQLTGRQTRWCSEACAKEMIRNHWLDVARKAALARDGERCVRCDRPGTDFGVGPRGLEVHHRDEHAKGRHHAASCCHHLDGLETLCRSCHIAEHKERPVERRPRRRRRSALPSPRPQNAYRKPELRSDQLAFLQLVADRGRVNAKQLMQPSGLTLHQVGRRLSVLAFAGAVRKEGGTWGLTPVGESHLAPSNAFEEASA